MPEIRMRVGDDLFTRYKPDAADGMVGSVVPLKAPDETVLCMADVVAAEVAEDGGGILLTLEVPPEVAKLLGPVSSGSESLRPFAVERDDARIRRRRGQ